MKALAISPLLRHDQRVEPLPRGVGLHITSIRTSSRSNADGMSGRKLSNRARRSRRRVFGSLIQTTAGPVSLSVLRSAKIFVLGYDRGSLP
jgi:hypothetical protein